MDVLDHSCSKVGFGGKMCIDGTKKFDEEIDESFQFSVYSSPFTHDEIAVNLKNAFPEIHEINIDLLRNEIPCLIISVKKDRIGHIKELHQQICESAAGIKMILYVEHTVDANDLPTALWRFCNNLDPKRDHILYKKQGTRNKDEQTSNRQPATSNYSACIGFDGTRKTKEFDNFNRDWPNIIVADDETIKAVNEKWNDLRIGEFISSPSLKFKDQLYGEEATVSDER
jgi:4-hydroxy-3-polyprenylbenzoate decarboxylase